LKQAGGKASAYAFTRMLRGVTVVAAALLAAACAGLPPARMEMPSGLAARAPEAVEGIGIGRSGRFTLGAEQSVRRVQGSPLALEQPIGHLLSHRGEPVGAIELNGATPRLWRPPADDALAEPVTRVALALLWDPADGVP
jgi:hypothetical protein